MSLKSATRFHFLIFHKKNRPPGAFSSHHGVTDKRSPQIWSVPRMRAVIHTHNSREAARMVQPTWDVSSNRTLPCRTAALLSRGKDEDNSTKTINTMLYRFVLRTCRKPYARNFQSWGKEEEGEGEKGIAARASQERHRYYRKVTHSKMTPKQRFRGYYHRGTAENHLQIVEEFRVFEICMSKL